VSLAAQRRMLDSHGSHGLPSRSAPRPGRKARIAAAVLVLWILSGIYIVPPTEQAVVTRFGAVADRRVYPGIHYSLPWPVDRVYRAKVNQLQRLVIGGDPADSVLGRTQPLAAQFLTGDQNIIYMRVVVQYSIAVPADFLFHSVDAAKTISSAVEAELARRVALRNVDAVLTTERVAIQDEVLGAAQERLDDYALGVRLSTINIENAAPPPEAADAFRDVASARADTSRIVDEAHGYANDLIPRARGEAMQLTESAEAYCQSRINEAAGDAARFNALAAEYAKASEVTGTRLYLEAMEEILPKIRKLILDADGNVDLSIIGKTGQK
jgi:modulator of FtsH protease HflK